jgi:hypothetical protein
MSIDLIYFILSAILLLLVAFLAVKYPKTVIIVLAVYIPFEEFILKWFNSPLYEFLRFGWEFLLLFMLSIILLNKVLKTGKILKTPIDFWLISFICSALGSLAINNISLFLGILGLRTLLRYVILFYLLTNLNWDEKYTKRLLKWICGVIVIQCLISFLQFVGGGKVFSFFAPKDVKIADMLIRQGYTSIYGERLMVFGTMARYNLLGNFLCFFALLFLGIYYETKFGQIKKLNWQSFFLITFIVLLLTTSRQSWLGLYLGLLFMYWIKKKKIKVFLIGLVPVFVTLFLWLIFAESDLYQPSTNPLENAIKRYLQIFTSRYIEGSHRGDRLGVTIGVSKEVMSKSPLFGFGSGIVEYGQVEKLQKKATTLRDIMVDPFMKQFIGDVGWVAILTQFGFLGLLSFVMMIFSITKIALQLYHNSQDSYLRGLSLGYLGAVAGIMIENFFCYNFTYRPVSFYFWLFSGIIVNFYRQKKK